MGCSSSTSRMRGGRSGIRASRSRIEGRYPRPEVLDVRVYRAAFLPALVALFVAAFSLVDRPTAATSPLPADAFDGARAFGSGQPAPRNSLRELVRAFPDRRPGSAADQGLAN